MPVRRLTPVTFFASVFGVGFLPFAPGTFGTLAAAAVYLLLPGINNYAFAAGLAVLCAISVVLSTAAEKTLGHDAAPIVIDEVCGYFLAVLFLPKTLMVALWAFILFRAFDIAKPWPISVSQRLPQGWGVTADDLIAGLFANILIRLLIVITPKFFGL